MLSLVLVASFVVLMGRLALAERLRSCRRTRRLLGIPGDPERGLIRIFTRRFMLAPSLSLVTLCGAVVADTRL